MMPLRQFILRLICFGFDLEDATSMNQAAVTRIRAPLR
jgi:hypothetical protein